MTKQFANFLQIAAAHSCHTLEIKEEYSGRGMKGKTTVAVITDDMEELLCDVVDYFNAHLCKGDAITTYDGEDVPEAEHLRRDKLANQTILY